MPVTVKRLDPLKPRVLRTEGEYDAAIAELDALLAHNPDPGSPERDRLDLLAVLVHAYDEEHYPMGQAATPQAVINFLLEQQGMTRANLASILGGRSRVSEFFSRKRRLSITQLKKLRQLLNVPADLLLDDTEGS